VYGIDMPTRDELIAHGRTNEEVCREITADRLVYQDIEALKKSIMDVNPALTSVEASCFDGIYITGDITPEYLDKLESHRHKSDGKSSEDLVRTQLNLNPAVAAE
jgi:amidophosphoribosyltransferase